MEKIITSKGIFDISIPANGGTSKSGEYYMVCPICTPTREKNHQSEKKFAINLFKIPYPWRCNHCNESGYVIDEAYMARAKIKPILVNKNFLPISEPLAQWFWEERKISKQTLLDLDVSSSVEPMRQMKNVVGEEDQHDKIVSKMCINFKYKKDGMLINIKYRDKNKNFKMIQDASKILYNIDSLKNEKEAIFVEGELDVLSFHECGIKNVVSVPNGTSISPAEVEEFNKTGVFRNNLNLEYLDSCMDDLAKIETFYLCTDDDIPGQKLREELARRFGKGRCKYVVFSEYKKPDGTNCKDGNDVLKFHGKDVLRNTLQHAYHYPISGVTTSKQHWGKMEKTYDNGRLKGYSTGYKSVDPHFLWMPGWTTLANGYPGEGKSSMLFNLAVITTVLYGWKWGMYCPENYPPENIIDTLAEILVGDTADIRFGDRMSKERYHHAVMQHIDKHFFFVDNEDGYIPEDLRQIKKSLIKQHGINCFLTDPWKNLKHKLGNNTLDMYIQEELTAEVRLSTKNDLLNVIVHHPPTPERNKDKTYPAPSIYDLIGGQVWASTCYAMFCIHKHDRVSWVNTESEFHSQRNKDQKLAGIPTDRNNPVILKFDRRSGRFYERKDIMDINSPYTVYPFENYQAQTQTTFDGF